MRFRITLKQEGRFQLIPINYQYELSSWIYRVIESADEEFSHFLHTQGYQKGAKNFKLFTFSKLHKFKYDRIKDRLKLLSDRLSLDVAFHIDQAAEKFIMGLFQKQSFRLGDKITQANLRVEQVSALPVTVSSTTMQFKAYSPIVIAKPKIDERGKLGKDYLDPTKDADYSDFFIKNLQEKYTSYLLQQNNEILHFDMNTPIQFKLLEGRVKSALIHIKAHTAEESQVKGFLYSFELTAPIPLLELGLNAGFGTQNALGFGYCGILGD